MQNELTTAEPANKPLQLTPRLREKIDRFRPMDDEFMQAMFHEDLELAQAVFPVFVGREDLIITSCESQAGMKQIAGARSVILDLYATDSQGRKYDLEVQKADDGANPMRARYHSSILDVENLHPGQDFTELPETYVIFLTEKDYYNAGKGAYHFLRHDVNNNLPLDDGSHIIYLNGEYRGDDSLGNLLHDFNCANPNDMKCDIMRKKAWNLKYTEEADKMASKIVQEYADEISEERIMNRNIEMAQSLLELKVISFEQIATVSKLPLEKVQELAAQMDTVTA